MATMESTASYLQMFGDMFMVFLFYHWLFAEKKDCIMPGEKFLANQVPRFYAVSSALLLVVVWATLEMDPLLAFATVAGSTLFFLVQDFWLSTDKKSAKLGHSERSDSAKLMLLLVIDARSRLTVSLVHLRSRFRYS